MRKSVLSKICCEASLQSVTAKCSPHHLNNLSEPAVSATAKSCSCNIGLDFAETPKPTLDHGLQSCAGVQCSAYESQSGILTLLISTQRHQITEGGCSTSLLWRQLTLPEACKGFRSTCPSPSQQVSSAISLTFTSFTHSRSKRAEGLIFAYSCTANLVCMLAFCMRVHGKQHSG